MLSSIYLKQTHEFFGHIARREDDNLEGWRYRERGCSKKKILWQTAGEMSDKVHRASDTSFYNAEDRTPWKELSIMSKVTKKLQDRDKECERERESARENEIIFSID